MEESVIADVSNYLVGSVVQIVMETDSVDYMTQYVDPTKFAETWNHPDPIQRKKWRTALLKEWGDMGNRNVYRRVKWSNMPKHRRCIRTNGYLKSSVMAHFVQGS